MKKILIFILLILTFSFVSCKKECKHKFLDATCTSPKICKLCRTTIGEPYGHIYKNGICVVCNNEDKTNSAVIINNAFKNTIKAGYIFKQKQVSKLIYDHQIYDSSTSTTKICSDGTNHLFDLSIRHNNTISTSHAFIEVTNNNISIYTKHNNTDYSKLDEDTTNKFLKYNINNNLKISAIDNMFILQDEVWIGNLTLINESIKEYLKQLTDLYPNSNFKFTKYNITLKDNYISTVDIVIMGNIIINDITLVYSEIITSNFFEIGSTEVTIPTNLSQ